MRGSVTPLVEGSVTNTTFVRLTSRMKSHVDLKTRRSRECFVAYLAVVWLFLLFFGLPFNGIMCFRLLVI